MMMRAGNDIGESLIEIVLTVVIVAVTVTALLSGLGTVGNAGNSQRRGVQADYVLRNYAAATKNATQGCVAGATYSVVYTPPTGFSVSGAGSVCPAVAVAAPGPLLTLTVTGPMGLSDSVVVRVRTP
jgi:hypothetical protein